MRLSYKVILELQELRKAARIDIIKNPLQPNQENLDLYLEILDEMLKSKSKHADFIELEEDIAFLKEYVNQQVWIDVKRWLANMDGTLREFWSNYMDSLTKTEEDKNNMDV